MVFKKAWRTAKGLARKAGRSALTAAKNRYMGPSKLANIANVVNDVKMIKALINVEKKYIQSASSTNTSCGQVFQATGSGHYIQEITANPASGSGVQARTGSSIKVTGGILGMQISQMGATTFPVKINVKIIRVKGARQAVTSGVNETTLTPKILQQNLFVYAANGSANPIYDYNSIRNPDYMRTFKVIANRNYRLLPDQFSGQTMFIDVKIPLKFKNYHVRFDKDTSTVDEGQLLFLVTADIGNGSAATPSTLNGVIATAVGTGISVQYYTQWYYVDN